MTYWRYWKLSGPPFSSDSRVGFFRGSSADEALARIEFLVENRRSVGAVVGASGVGKTSILRNFASSIPRLAGVPNIEAVRISMLGLGEGDLLVELSRFLCGGSGVSKSGSAWHRLCDYFLAATQEGTQTVLLVDDIESSSPAAEDDLNRLISVSFPLTVIFAVDSQFTASVSRSLWEHCVLQIELPAWEQVQTTVFLDWTARRLGRSTPLFSTAAAHRIHEYSGGIARRIVQLADIALVAGAVAQASIVDLDCLDQVAQELPKSSSAA